MSSQLASDGIILSTAEASKLMIAIHMHAADLLVTKGFLKANLCVPQLPGQGCSFHSFRTNTYKLTFTESPSGIKIILVTHPRTSDLRESLFCV
ncbi:hypothetical protein CerSpe_069550 [Prunus speciosa]